MIPRRTIDCFNMNKISQCTIQGRDKISQCTIHDTEHDLIMYNTGYGTESHTIEYTIESMIPSPDVHYTMGTKISQWKQRSHNRNKDLTIETKISQWKQRSHNRNKDLTM